MPKRALVIACSLLVVLYAAIVVAAFIRPPISIPAAEYRRRGNTFELGLILENRGLVPASLVSLRLEGGRSPSTAAVMVGDIHEPLLGNEVLPMEGLGSIKGMLIRPGATSRGLASVLVVTFTPEPTVPDTLVIAYRYLGWPMTVRYRTSVLP